MSIPWGPALDAELAYRHEQARHDFRRWSWRRKPAKKVDETLARHQLAQDITAQHIPAQRGAVPLTPARPRPVDRLAVPQQSTLAQTSVDQAQSSAHAA